MTQFKNKRKDNFLRSLPQTSLCDDKVSILKKCKFNFSYFDNNQKPYSTSFNELSEKDKSEFYQKLIEFSKFSLEHWQKIGIGNGRKRSHVLDVYGTFPRKSKFVHPAHVPHDVKWARFRYGDTRLVGFICPESVICENGNKSNLDTNTFYVVFLDLGHNFYLTEK